MSTVDDLLADAETVARYASAPPRHQRGRPLLEAFAALQRITEFVAKARRNGEAPAGLFVPEATALLINGAMARVAASIAALPSLSRSGDLPAIRAALGLTETWAQSRAAQRKAELVKAVTVAVGRQRLGLDPPCRSTQGLFEAVGRANGCSAPTARRAWLASGRNIQQVMEAVSVRWTLQEQARAPSEPAPTRRLDRSKTKAAIDRALRKNV